jgi:S-formylglutathione hydrolase FrmB
MAFFSGNIFSFSIGMRTQLQVFLPHDEKRYVWKEPPKTLILLHGLSDDASSWNRLTSVQRYAEKYNLALVMPEVQRSFYIDMKNGRKYFTYISKELPAIIKKLFKTSLKREDLMIAGLSMGGYGAMRCAFTYPECFGYCGAFSGVYSPKTLYASLPETGEQLRDLPSDFRAIFGENIELPESEEISSIVKKAREKRGGNLPELYMSCGTDDFLYRHSADLHKSLKDMRVEHIYEEWPGIHEWGFWDESVRRMLVHFLGEGRQD